MFCSNIIISGKTIFLLILNEFYGRIIVPDIIGGSVSRTIINKRMDFLLNTKTQASLSRMKGDSCQLL